MRDDDDPSWHDQQPVIAAGGVAALILLALLAFAVLNTADKSSRPPGPLEFAPSSITSSTPPEEEPGVDEDATSTTNPHLTTTPTNAGHI